MGRGLPVGESDDSAVSDATERNKLNVLEFYELMF